MESIVWINMKFSNNLLLNQRSKNVVKTRPAHGSSRGISQNIEENLQSFYFTLARIRIRAVNPGCLCKPTLSTGFLTQPKGDWERPSAPRRSTGQQDCYRQMLSTWRSSTRVRLSHARYRMTNITLIDNQILSRPCIQHSPSYLTPVCQTAGSCSDQTMLSGSWLR